MDKSSEAVLALQPVTFRSRTAETNQSRPSRDFVIAIDSVIGNWQKKPNIVDLT